MIEGAQTVEQPQSLRDVLSEVVTEAETALPESKPDRARDEGGRFAATDKVEKPEAKPAAEKEPKEAAKPVVEAPAYTAPPRPSTWKKELETHWPTLPKEIHEEILRREADYAKGVSTYKSEYDRLKPLGEALRPYEPLLQQSGLSPDKFIHALATTHQTLTQGSREQKLREFARFAQEYQIPLNELLIQGEDGKVYFNQQYMAQPQQPQGLTPEEVDRRFQQNWVQVERQRQLKEFLEAKDGSGNPLHPHFDEVKATMDGLLRAGLAQDLQSAYQAALRHPTHSSIYEAQQKQQREAEEAEKIRKADEAAKKAKQNAVSAKPRTPTSPPSNGARKGLRETIEETVEEHSRSL